MKRFLLVPAAVLAMTLTACGPADTDAAPATSMSTVAPTQEAPAPLTAAQARAAERDFMNKLRAVGIPDSTADSVSAANSMCGAMDRGGSYQTVLDTATDYYTLRQSTAFVDASIEAFCPEHTQGSSL